MKPGGHPSAPRQLLHVGTEPCPESLAAHLHQRGWTIEHARSLKAALPLLRQASVKVVLFMPGPMSRELAAEVDACRSANELCEWVAVLEPGALEAPFVRDFVLTHCFDHHTQPVDGRFLAQSLGHAWGRAQLRTAGAAEAAASDLGMIGTSAAITQLRRIIRRTAGSDAAVLVEGESGSGKEVAARALHAASPHAEGPFVTVNGGVMDQEPATVFEQAAGGTLFIDHVDDMPLDWQARLVRFMAECSVRRAKLGRDWQQGVRFVAATEASLAERVAAQRFRQDLFYRLNVVPLSIAPLRQRKEDIPLLAGHFLDRNAGRGKGFSRQALAAMKAHDWPGNVRELGNRVQRALLLAEGRQIGAEDLGLEAASLAPQDSLDAIRVQAERDAITVSLDRFSHNVSLAARELGVSRMTMYRLMAKHAITPRAA